jgi:hypothetical protein
MRPISHYFSLPLINQFERELPTLRKAIGVKPFRERDDRFGVAGETFRALRGLEVQPSALYRRWAAALCHELDTVNLLENLGSRDAFLTWHSTLVNELSVHWRKHGGGELSFAHKNKLIDLFVKWLSSYDFGSMAVSSGFVAHANCALDRQTLTKLNECLSYALPMPSPSMGHIGCKNAYELCQSIIGEFAEQIGGTRLLFDYFAWRRGG